MKSTTSRLAANITRPPTTKGSELRRSYSGLPPKYTSSAPRPPMKLMIPLAWLRKRDGVMSGIRAITGERNRAMDRFMSTMTSIISAQDAAAALADRDEDEEDRGEDRAHQDVGPAPPQAGAGPVAQRAEEGKQHDGQDVVDGHDQPDERGAQAEAVLQEDRARRRCTATR